MGWNGKTTIKDQNGPADWGSNTAGDKANTQLELQRNRGAARHARWKCARLRCRFNDCQEHNTWHREKKNNYAWFPPRGFRETGAKAHLRMEKPVVKPSSKIWSHPQDCSAGHQETRKWYKENEGRESKLKQYLQRLKRRKRTNHCDTRPTVNKNFKIWRRNTKNVENVERDWLIATWVEGETSLFAIKI